MRASPARRVRAALTVPRTACQPSSTPAASMRLESRARLPSQGAHQQHQASSSPHSYRQHRRHLATTTTSATPTPTPSHPPPTEHCDAVILGGGVVGLALAAALVSASQLTASPSPLRLILLDAGDLTRLTAWAEHKETQATKEHIDFENRVVSLTSANWAWLQEIGVSPFLVHHRVQPVHSMHVTDGLTGAAIDLGESSSSSSSTNNTPLSYMVELTNLQQALLRFIHSHSASSRVQVHVWDKCKVHDIAPDQPQQPSSASRYTDAWPILTTTATPNARIRPRLLIGADGPSSPVRRYAGIQKYGWPYHRKGLVATLRYDSSQNDAKGGGSSTAYQRFLKTGTVAWLPLSPSTASTVWALPPDLAQTMTLLHRLCAAHNQPSILADLINASWRLPWSSLATVLNLLLPTAAEPAIADVDILRKQIRAHLQAAEEQGTIVAEQDCPPLVKDVDARSVASFPLSVAHTECYLGSSLTSSPTSPSNILQSAMSFAGLWSKEEQAATTPHRRQGRTVLIGDAAHTVHPLAGQGLNLGIADARSLARTLCEATAVGGDWGSHESLKAYESDRYLANQAMLSGVDHLFWLFGAGGETLEQARQRAGAPRPDRALDPANAIVWARSTGMEVLNELDWVKRRIQRSAGS